MEETSEKSEKTEKSEEAIHSIYHSKKFGKTLFKGLAVREKITFEAHILSIGLGTKYHLPTDFNIHFIYHTSYLELVG